MSWAWGKGVTGAVILRYDKRPLYSYFIIVNHSAIGTARQLFGPRRPGGGGARSAVRLGRTAGFWRRWHVESASMLALKGSRRDSLILFLPKPRPGAAELHPRPQQVCDSWQSKVVR